MEKLEKSMWIAIIAVVIITVGGYFVFQGTGNNDHAESPIEDTEQEDQEGEEQGDSGEGEAKENEDRSPSDHQSFQHMEYTGDIAPDFSAEELTELPTNNWITFGGNIYNGRYSPLNRVDENNVAELKADWVTSLGSGFDFKYSGEATPLVYDGVMFTITGANNVSALDATTGEIIWEFRPKLPDDLDTLCCGWASRGVALGDGKVYVALLDARLVALDQKTGEVVWETRVDEWEKGYTITSAPLFYDGKVYTGIAGGEYGIRGYVAAYDADLGRQIWRSYTIPAPGEPGHETWPEDNDAWIKGGAPVWQTPAVDPELNMIYFATGNTSPDLDGSNREGDNLYADSMLALDADTGEYQWHFQQVHHDIWDLDPANPVVLYDVEMDGEMKKGIAQAGKTGWVYMLDRTNGEPLIGIEEKEVPQNENQKTSPTQPFPEGDAFVPQEITEEDIERDLPEDFEGEVGSIFTPFWDEPVTIKPSPQGGGNWPPSAYNPDTELFYVLGNDNYFAYAHYAEDEANKFEEGKEWIGSIWQPISDAPFGGTVTALDIKTNRIVWQKEWDTIAYSGILTTKGNLVFVGHNDGRIIAYNATTGDQVWEFMTDAGANAPPITYEVDGKQYVSIFSAGNSLAGTKHGDKIYTFSLDGEFESLEDISDEDINRSPIQSDEAEEAEEQNESQGSAVENGQKVYENNCLACHGAEGVGGHNGPNLQNSPMLDDDDSLIQQILHGSGAMPGFEDSLDEDEINALVEYLKSLKNEE
ncbi:alcohol dehydrogenase (cytochrome c) [Oceanobacillus limi]|uniref:Alcohol dehydrogenase (Cytochrome c) n=1 Tax=Oceanobacillus limi TaxID=930131 RepID=A0A1I0FIM6_9BACI|nr:PQQ-binding-like beta-propeller repeat protein [Oceanobacillus limi]SET57295.1 alcohol dehydrogenase (cytochrome c) [Oceanobacillus limi]